MVGISLLLVAAYAVMLVMMYRTRDWFGLRDLLALLPVALWLVVGRVAIRRRWTPKTAGLVGGAVVFLGGALYFSDAADGLVYGAAAALPMGIFFGFLGSKAVQNYRAAEKAKAAAG